MIANFNDHAANERTFLAWVRTAIALVGFGLAIEKLAGSGTDATSQASALGLIAVGAVVIVLAFVRLRRLKVLIDATESEEANISRGDGLLAAIVVGLAGLMVLFVLHIT